MSASTGDGAPTAALIIIGNEILSGKVQDANTPFAIAELRTLGVQVGRVALIQDTVASIAAEVAQCAAAYRWVFTSGGLGPTHDDLTMKGVAAAFGLALRQDPRLVKRLEGLTEVSEARRHALLRLTWVPDGADLIWGDAVDRVWPTVTVKNVYIFPGVPRFFRSGLTSLRSMLRSAPFVTRSVYCLRSEMELLDAIDATVAAHPSVDIGSYPAFESEDHRLRLTFDARDGAAVEAAVATFSALAGEAVSVVR